MSFFNREDTISFRHHVYKRNPPHLRDEQGNKKDDVELAEVGPRFEMKPYKIVLGTLEMKAAETEWVLKTHYKRDNYWYTTLRYIYIYILYASNNILL
eukprot:UN00417